MARDLITRRNALALGIAAAMSAMSAGLSGCTGNGASNQAEEGSSNSSAQSVASIDNPAQTGDALLDFAANSCSVLIGPSKANSCFSPLSFYMACALLGIGCSGQTQEQVLNTLGKINAKDLLNECDRIYSQVQYFNTCGTGLTQAELEAHLMLGCSAWANSSYRFAKGFRKLIGSPSRRLENKYNAQLRSIEMGTQEADDEISAWVSDETGGILTPKIQTKAAEIAQILSTVYLKDNWAMPFDSQSTKEGDFAAASGKVKASYMALEDDICPYGSIGDCAVADKELAFTGASVRFILPPEGTDPRELFADAAKAADLLGKKLDDSKSIAWKIPKFSLVADIELENTAKAQGITKVFEANDDFATMFRAKNGTSASKTLVSSVKQAVYLSVDELGIKATSRAVANTPAATLGSPQKAELTLDRPFAYAVLAGSQNIPLLAGCVLDPTAK